MNARRPADGAGARRPPAAASARRWPQACDVEACDGAGPLSAWVSALGGFGSVLGDGNATTLTYNFGGAAAGIDYRFDPRFLRRHRRRLHQRHAVGRQLPGQGLVQHA